MGIAARRAAIMQRQRSNVRDWVRNNNTARRVATTLLMLGIALIKAVPPLRRMVPTQVRLFAQSWDWEMLRSAITSFGSRIYIDQPCVMPDPPTWQPLAEVDEQWRLSEDQIRSFYENGFLGPLTLCSREEMISLREQVWAEIEQPSKTYGFITGRDRHLDCPAVWDLIKRPEWTERLAQLLGPNLQLWRSQLFLKEPGAPEVTWHQASTYLSEEGYKATLWPTDRNELFQLTTWIAFDDVDYDNGNMQFVKGSHRRINTAHIGAKDGGGFARTRFKLEADITDDKVVNMPMQAGQFVIFSERCIHGSPPNASTDRRRWGMAFRTIKPSVKVYDTELRHHVMYLREEYSLENWGAVVLRGEDDAGVNRLTQPPSAGAASSAEPPLQAAV